MRQNNGSRRTRNKGGNSNQGNNNNNNNRRQIPLRHQTFDSVGPDGRIRGNAWQVHEKYVAMARDATSAGDRVKAENLMQHAEHYWRIINADGAENAGRGNNNQQQPSGGGDNRGRHDGGGGDRGERGDRGPGGDGPQPAIQPAMRTGEQPPPQQAQPAPAPQPLIADPLDPTRLSRDEQPDVRDDLFS